jgi:hypothetical protein
MRPSRHSVTPSPSIAPPLAVVVVRSASPDEENARPDRLVVVVNFREELKANLGSK